MKINMPNVPELDEVTAADEATITITKVPCGTCYTTRFFKEKQMLHQHQQVMVDAEYLQAQGVTM